MVLLDVQRTTFLIHFEVFTLLFWHCVYPGSQEPQFDCWCWIKAVSSCLFFLLFLMSSAFLSSALCFSFTLLFVTFLYCLLFYHGCLFFISLLSFFFFHLPFLFSVSLLLLYFSWCPAFSWLPTCLLTLLAAHLRSSLFVTHLFSCLPILHSLPVSQTAEVWCYHSSVLLFSVESKPDKLVSRLIILTAYWNHSVHKHSDHLSKSHVMADDTCSGLVYSSWATLWRNFFVLATPCLICRSCNLIVVTDSHLVHASF